MPGLLREGHFIELEDGTIFEVKGETHPPGRVVAYPRYLQDPRGDRQLAGRRYRRLRSLEEKLAVVHIRYPQYYRYDEVFDLWLPEPPLSAIKRVYEPTHRLQELTHAEEPDPATRATVDLALLLAGEAAIPIESLGVSGSVLVGLQTPGSDIDLLVYGHEPSRRVQAAIRRLRQDEGSGLRPLEGVALHQLAAARGLPPPLEFRAFGRLEARKTLMGLFQGRLYSLRYLRDSEASCPYGVFRYRGLGACRIRGLVVDASESHYTPSLYRLGEVRVVEGHQAEPITELVSFRIRFCEQAQAGERIEARGRLEAVICDDGPDHYRLVVGGSAQDYLLVEAAT